MFSKIPKHFVSVIVIGLSLSGCFPTTKYHTLSPREKQLSSSNKTIFYYKSDPECEQCFNTVERAFKKHNIELVFIPYEEYNFKKAGILNPLDSQYYHLLYKRGITHFLIADLVEKTEKESLIEFYTPYELGLRHPSNASSPYGSTATRDNSTKATLKFSLYSIERKKTTYRLTVKTTLSSVISRDDDGSETHYNLGGVSMAVSHGLFKGTKRVLKECAN